MKHLPLKLGIFVVLLFSAVIAVCLLWIPIKIKYYVHRLKSDNPEEKINAIDNLIKLGDKGKEALKKNFIEGEWAAKILINSWSDVNSPIPAGYGKHKAMPLIAACNEEYTKVASLLLKKGANIDGTEESRGRTALWWAIVMGNEDIVQFLIDRGASIQYVEHLCIEHPIHWLATMGDYKHETHGKALNYFFDKGGNANLGKKLSEEKPLHWAVEYKQKELSELLVSKGADIEAQDSEGSRPLHLAIYAGDVPTIEYLVSKGADVTAKKRNGARPLHGASRYATKRTIELLIEKGADIKAVTNSGFTCLHIAAFYGRLDLLEFYLEKGLDIEAEVEGGWRPLHHAAFEERKECAAFLLEKGADVNAVSKSGMTPLDCALDKSHSETAELIRSHGGKAGEALKKESDKK
ncbi:MAG: ankyrin repeat domain-containing protein [Planctomycetota bacterium]|nr:MAG: ankyrin repeat domain-containing protein [Planctomycetota bacterium]